MAPFFIARKVQMDERPATNREAVGSTPSMRTKF